MSNDIQTRIFVLCYLLVVGMGASNVSAQSDFRFTAVELPHAFRSVVRIMDEPIPIVRCGFDSNSSQTRLASAVYEQSAVSSQSHNAFEYHGIPNHAASYEQKNLSNPQMKRAKDSRSPNRCQLACNHVRAGCPLSISRWAACTYNTKYQGYYIGGGVPPGRKKHGQHGEPRYTTEGTWGVDYAPWYSRVALNWSHGRLFQGGTGQYEPDHKNRPFGLTFGTHFGNKDRRFQEQESEEIHFQSELQSATDLGNGHRH